jgi:putative DNA primase/helicase
MRDAFYAADNHGTPEELWDRAHRNIWPEPNDAREVAQRFVENAETNTVPLRCWNGIWLSWTGTHYRRLTIEDVRDDLYDLLGNVYYQDGDGKLHKWKPLDYKLNRVIDATRGLVKLPAGMQAPSWLDGLTEDRVIPCANGLLRINDRARLEHTPDYFNLFALPYDYDPTAKWPRWLQFLTEVFGDDTEAVELLQDWFFYVLTGRTDLQVMLLWIGPKRGGKGTVARVLKRLIGPAAYAGLSIDAIRQRFGLQEHIHTSLGVFPDEDQIDKSDGKHFVAFIKKVTGEDDVFVDIKNQKPWNGRLPMRFMYQGNIMPALPDASGAVLTRILPLRTIACFADNPDRKLEDVLTQELPGILNWALNAKLARRGKFVIPASAASLLSDIDTHSNPVRQFLSECPSLIFGNDEQALGTTLYACYETWRDTNKITAYGDARWFGRQLPSAMVDLHPDVKFERKQHNAEPGRPYYYHGVGLRTSEGGPRLKVIPAERI